MSRIDPISPAQADADTTATLEGVRRKFGALPNIFTTFAHSPAALGGYLRLGESLAGGRLTAPQRERIALAVAEENACQYCLSAHAAIGKGAGLTEHDVEQARAGRAPDAVDNEITALALKVLRSRGAISGTDLDAARREGVDDGLIVEIVATVALNVMTNYLNNVAGTEIDFPVVQVRAAA